MATQQEIRDTLTLVQITAEAIREAGKEGIPAGHLYAALMSKGCGLNTHVRIVRTLINAGLIQKKMNLLTWIAD